MSTRFDMIGIFIAETCQKWSRFTMTRSAWPLNGTGKDPMPNSNMRASAFWRVRAPAAARLVGTNPGIPKAAERHL